MGIALGMVTSYIKVWEMTMDGSVALLTMLFICLIGYWFGSKYGITAGAAYGILQFAIDPYMLSVPQVLLDYPFTFGALGLSGFFRNHKYSLQLTFYNLIFTTSTSSSHKNLSKSLKDKNTVAVFSSG